MKHLYIIVIFLLALFACAISHGDNESAHQMAHIGASYICEQAIFGVMNKGLEAPRLTSHLFGASICTMVGAAYEEMNHASSSYMLNRMGYNSAGIVLSIGTIELFKF